MLAFKISIRSFLAALLLFSTLAAASAQSPVHRSAYHDYRAVKLVDGLSHPWSHRLSPGR